MTSNVGADMIMRQGSLGFQLKVEEEVEEKLAYRDMRKKLTESLKRVFRPEFINRIDEVVVFHPLAKEQIRSIANIQIDYLRKRLKDRDMGLEVSETALDKLGEAGFDPVYGARPLKRAIQQQLENPLAQDILAGKFLPGDVIDVDLDDDKLTFRKSSKKAAAA
jgi:ATP-dependent Clp protease ATP-binding subunit ClpB